MEQQQNEATTEKVAAQKEKKGKTLMDLRGGIIALIAGISFIICTLICHCFSGAGNLIQ